MKFTVGKKIAQVLFALFGAFLGFYIPLPLMVLLREAAWSPRSVLLLQVALVIVTTLIGWLIAGPVLNRIIGLTKWMEGKLQKMSTQDLLCGAIGLIIGLIVAFFIGYALSFLPLIGPYMPVVACLVLGYLGISLGIRKRED